MSYSLFLFDADDTLFDFQVSERSSFAATLDRLRIDLPWKDVYASYKTHGLKLWRQLECGEITKDFLKTERFKLTFGDHKIEASEQEASDVYLNLLAENVHLIDGAREICEFLARKGELAIITNGMDTVQRRRLENSGLAPHISFMAVSEECGFAKPDRRFFEYTCQRAKNFSPSATLMIGDRVEADIDGAHDFGLDACWFNPGALKSTAKRAPKFEIRDLSELRKLVR